MWMSPNRKQKYHHNCKYNHVQHPKIRLPGEEKGMKFETLKNKGQKGRKPKLKSGTNKTNEPKKTSRDT